MAALPASSISANAQFINTHSVPLPHNPVGRDMVQKHLDDSSRHVSESSHENNMKDIPDGPSASTLSSGTPFHSSDASRFPRTRALGTDVIRALETEYSSLFNRAPPTASMIPEDSKMYQRLMLEHRLGYPLYHPEPKSDLPIEYQRNGIRIGDVGLITPDGAFDFLFNVDSAHAGSANPPTLPRDFETVPPIEIVLRECFQSGQYLLSDHVQQTQVMPITYKFAAPEGSVLQLPEGAALFEATETNFLYDLAARNAWSWYEYMYTRRSRDIPNGSLYLVTGCIKTRSWGIGALHGHPSDLDFLEFISEDNQTHQTYGWRKSGPITTKVGPILTDIIATDSEVPNQCVFIRGYKIALGKKLWQKVRNPLALSSEKEGGLEFPSSPVARSGQRSGLGNRSNVLNQTPSGSAFAHAAHSGTIENPLDDGKLGIDPDYRSISYRSDEESEGTPQPILGVASPTHPSDIIISILTQLEPEAEVAIVHDSEWCSLLPKNFVVDPSPNLDIRGLLENIVGSCLVVVDQNACVSLVEKVSDNFFKRNGLEPGLPTDVQDIKDTLSRSTQINSEVENNIETSNTVAALGGCMRQRSPMGTAQPNHPNVVMTASNNGFPDEIIEEILNHLELPSIMRCRAVCSAFRELIDSSPYFHWKRELAISGKEDGKCYPLAVRRQMLEKYQQGWASLQWAMEKKKQSVHGEWDLKGNVFAQSGPDKTVIYFDQLASPLRNIEGSSWTLHLKATRMEDFTMDPAQDLLVITESPVWQQGQYVCRIFLLTLSTGDYHPLATRTQILTHISTDLQWIRESWPTSICGENLCILFDDATETEIKLWNWKTGQVVANIMSRRVQNQTFLSERYIMVSTDQDHGLTVIDFMAESQEKQMLSDVTNAYTFRFPPLVETAHLFAVLVQSSPANWKPHSALSAPFFTTRNDKLHVITLFARDTRGDNRQVQLISLDSTFLTLIESAARLNTTCFAWPMWGPNGARMIVSTFPDFVSYNPYGTRLASTHRPEGEWADYVYIYDFNQLALKWSGRDRKTMAELEIDDDEAGSMNEGREGRSPPYVDVTEPTKIAPGEIFQDEVETRLGYRMKPWAIPGQPRVLSATCVEDGILLMYGESNIEEVHILTI